MGENYSDQVLVKRAKKGDTQAFDLLVRKYQHRVVALVSRYISDHAECQDVAQEAFLKAWRAIDSFRGDSAFYTWLYRIASNMAKNHLVSRKRRPPANDVDASEAVYGDGADKLSETATPDHEMIRREIEQTVVDVVKELPKELRQAITLREVEGLSYTEIAKAMDCPVGTVRSRIFRAREAVDEQIKPLLSGYPES